MVMLFFFIFLTVANIFGFADITVNLLNKSFGTHLTGLGMYMIFFIVILLFSALSSIEDKIIEIQKTKGDK